MAGQGDTLASFFAGLQQYSTQTVPSQTQQRLQETLSGLMQTYIEEEEISQRDGQRAEKVNQADERWPAFMSDCRVEYGVEGDPLYGSQMLLVGRVLENWSEHKINTDTKSPPSADIFVARHFDYMAKPFLAKLAQLNCQPEPDLEEALRSFLYIAIRYAEQAKVTHGYGKASQKIAGEGRAELEAIKLKIIAPPAISSRKKINAAVSAYDDNCFDKWEIWNFLQTECLDMLKETSPKMEQFIMEAVSVSNSLRQKKIKSDTKLRRWEKWEEQSKPQLQEAADELASHTGITNLAALHQIHKASTEISKRWAILQ